MKRSREQARGRGIRVVRAGAPRWMLALLGLLALAVQSFVVQAHIHVPKNFSRVAGLWTPADGAAAQSMLVQKPAGAVPRDNNPVSGDPTNCPICQEAAHAGAFLQSAVSFTAIPASTRANFAPSEEENPASLTASHNWHSRAPPQA